MGPGLLRRSIGDTCVVIDSEVPFYLASRFAPFEGTLGKGGAGWLSFVWLVGNGYLLAARVPLVFTTFVAPIPKLIYWQRV